MTFDDLEGSCSLRGPIPAQTVESMYDDYKRFIASGGDNEKVKFCKGEPFFPIPLNQINNQNNTMVDQCIYACANKGLPSSMRYSYCTNSTQYIVFAGCQNWKEIT